jgi:hypothetical protein
MNVTCGGTDSLAVVESEEKGTCLVHGLGKAHVDPVSAHELHALAHSHQCCSPFGHG